MKKSNSAFLNNKSLISKVKAGLCVFLVIVMSYCFFRVSSAPYQIFRDIFYYLASVAFMTIVIMIRKVRFTKLPIGISTLIYCGYSIHFMIEHYNDGGRDLKIYYACRQLLRLFIVILLVDIIFSKKISELNKENKLYVILAMVAMSLCIVLRPNAAMIMIIPAIFLYFTPLSKEKWNKMVLLISLGYYINFLLLTTYSLITVPIWNSFIEGSRYYFGCFGTPYEAGAFALEGMVAAIYLFEYALKNSGKVKAIKSICIIMIAFPIITALISGSRSILLSLMAVMYIYLIYHYKCDEKQGRKKILVINILLFAIIFSVLILLGIGAIISKCIDDPNVFFATIPFVFLQKNIRKLLFSYKWLFSTDSIAGVFPDGGFINILDRMISGRLSIWYETLRTVSLFGSENIATFMDFGPHNIYIIWILRFGIIGGIPVILAVLYGFYVCVRKAFAKRQEYLMPLLWMCCFLVSGIGEEPLMQSALYILFMVFQYPLLIQFEEEK